jgi:hypothetical protein
MSTNSASRVDAAGAEVGEVHAAPLANVTQSERSDHVGADGFDLIRLTPVDMRASVSKRDMRWSRFETPQMRQLEMKDSVSNESVQRMGLTLGRPVTPAALIAWLGWRQLSGLEDGRARRQHLHSIQLSFNSLALFNSNCSMRQSE